MSYNPTNWQAGDTVTSAKLNKMEQGIANGGIQIIHIDENNTLDKTWQEIHDGGFGIITYEDNGSWWCELITEIREEDNKFIVQTISTGGYGGIITFIYNALSSDDYPVWEDPNAPTSEDDPTSESDDPSDPNTR